MYQMITENKEVETIFSKKLFKITLEQCVNLKLS